jgi:hypothetical protein
MTYPAPSSAPQIGTGIGQQPGTVAPVAPSPYGAGVSPTIGVADGVVTSPVIEEYGAPIDVGPQMEKTPIQTFPVPTKPAAISGTALLAIGGGALAFYYLFLKKRR